ncbi:hypothetical protein V474_20665 [Novosphingobium barchaimii LL02]|uniref:Uncharacterized protein n=1 Tax=Novosphingobium barchaimii LL02 TaxID=1114963 RepID=A0A0J7XWI1_9SPHN|nr:hypothetical protein V474_20665 [Novosphingobium barchaimii LL02]
MVAVMARIVALAQAPLHIPTAGMLRPLVVGGCALALILARTSLPF